MPPEFRNSHLHRRELSTTLLSSKLSDRFLVILRPNESKFFPRLRSLSRRQSQQVFVVCGGLDVKNVLDMIVHHFIVTLHNVSFQTTNFGLSLQFGEDLAAAIGTVLPSSLDKAHGWSINAVLAHTVIFNGHKAFNLDRVGFIRLPPKIFADILLESAHFAKDFSFVCFGEMNLFGRISD